uniref:AT-rich interactive domain-containing protein 5A-like n=2 Tax=Gouania willdenowi TaxID=441366 RepID=A0A8C5I132_GOUWI
TELQMEEKAFVSSLHSFMKDKGTPIERIPHLGFKQINLWKIYKVVDKLGGYDSVTARRLWKKVYDELGGSPGSTSAATCTRRHYERLVLLFERHLKGEEDKPVPSSKPRKPYKRNLSETEDKAEGKRKRAFTDKDNNSDILVQKISETSPPREAAMLPHSALWASSSHCSQLNTATSDLCASHYSHIHQAQTSASWIAHTSHSAREAISPLEKKKRMAQASLNLPRSSQSKDKERPSVIHRWPSSSKICSSPDSSPQPPSSSSSRSTSPISVPSEDETADREDKAELSPNCHSAEEDKTETSKNISRQNKDSSHVRSKSLSPNSVKCWNKNSAWKPYLKGTYLPHSFQPSTPFCGPTSSSSFTKVVPKSVQLQQPAPVQPRYKGPQRWMHQQDDAQIWDKKLSHVNLWPYQTERRDNSRTIPQKVYPSQQNACQLSSWTSRYPIPLNPVVLPNRMRFSQPQLMYRHIPVGPALYSYPYTAPLVHPPIGYSIPAINPIYSHKM